MISAVLLVWKRPEHLHSIIDSILGWGRISELVIWNNNPDLTIKADGVKATIINSSRNFYCFTRYAMIPLLENETILFHDDDLILHPQQLEKLYENYAQDAGRIYGPFGKRLVDGTLYHETPAGLRARSDAIGYVDVILGRCSLFNRSLYQRAFKHIPLPIKYEDDVAFSLAATRANGKKHLAVNVGPIFDICGGDEHSSHRTKGFAQAREAIVQRLR